MLGMKQLDSAIGSQVLVAAQQPLLGLLVGGNGTRWEGDRGGAAATTTTTTFPSASTSLAGTHRSGVLLVERARL